MHDFDDHMKGEGGKEKNVALEYDPENFGAYHDYLFFLKPS